MDDQDFRKKTQIEVIILLVSIATALSLIQFQYKKVEGNPVPTVIFKDNPSLFHAFVLSLNFAFFGSFTSLTLRHGYPKVAKACLLLSLVSIATGLGILIWLILPVAFNLVREYLYHVH